MKEIIEVRVSADKARRYLPEGAGEDHGLVRRFKLELDDPLLEMIREHEREEQKRGTTAVTYWEVLRNYTAAELGKAELFWLRVRPFFEPTGEDCGTVYDDAQACPRCHVGSRQVGPLRLDVKRVPKRDIAQTLGGELVVSARLAEALEVAGIRGHALGPVEGKNGKESPAWRQLLLPECTVELSERTRVGHSFFVPEPDEARCPGHVAGFDVLTEAFVERGSVGELDWHCTRQAVGQRLGPYRPLPLVFISPRLYRLLVDVKAKRFDVEVAHLAL